MSKVKFKIIDGGKAIPIGNNLYKLEGRSHEEGGIGIELTDGNAKTIIEAERKEIFEPKAHEFRILSNSLKIGNKTPAQLAEAGYNPDIIFKAQQSINGNYGGSYAKDGSEKEIKKENIPTKEEYITQKLDSIRNNALEKSRNKTQDETTAVTEADVYGKKALINQLQAVYNHKLRMYNATLRDIYDNYKENNPVTSEIYTNIKDIENDKYLKRGYEQLNEAKRLLEDAKNGKYNGQALNNCIANLSEFYPHGLPYGNQTFKANPGKYGFSLIDTWGVEPGDLIQHIENNKPHHAMIYNGTDNNGMPTFNYSDGGEPAWNGTGGYGTNKHYPDAVAEDGKHLWDVDVYRYTGTPQDSIQWSNEYDQKYGKTLKNGGQINMKLKHKNKQDITDMVMNEILPHSTGKRKKFILGGSEWSLIGNLGLNLLNGVTQGIIGSINSGRLTKMYKGLKRQSTYVPTPREHINTKVDVEPQLNLTAETEYNLRRNAMMNTANAKVARSQARIAALDRVKQDNIIYSDKFNKETALRNAEAELQTRYNIADTQNKIGDIREQNEFDLNKTIGIANAKTSAAQTWGQGIASTLLNAGQSLTDYSEMTNDLLKSNSGAAHDKWFANEFGMYKNKVNDAEWIKNNKDWYNTYKNTMIRLGWINS